MAVEDVLARISQIEALASRFSAQSTAGVSGVPFGAVLERAATGQPRAASLVVFDRGVPTLPGGAATVAAVGADAAGAGRRMLAAAAAELGVAEEPPGSNDGRRIDVYRSADRSVAGMPWCATFVSWAAGQAGAPIGERGQGYAAVEDIEAWGRRTGRLLSAEATPRPGDIILYGGRHVGIVESVGPGERVTTVEGNHSHRVERVERQRSEATGYVRL